MKANGQEERENKRSDGDKLALYKRNARSKITNGNKLLPGIDHRRGWVRRFRDVLSLHVNDMGGPDNCSEAELAIARRAACLIVELELLERKFALNGEAKNWQLHAYQRGANTLRRLLESLHSGLERRPRDVTTLGEVLRVGSRSTEEARP
jgi:hypothetical protein